MTTIVQNVIDAFRGVGFEVREELGAGHPFAVTGTLDSAALLLEAALIHESADPATGPRVRDMALLVARLSYALKKAEPGNPLPARATVFLKKHDLIGSPLRGDNKTA